MDGWKEGGSEGWRERGYANFFLFLGTSLAQCGPKCRARKSDRQLLGLGSPTVNHLRRFTTADFQRIVRVSAQIRRGDLIGEERRCHLGRPLPAANAIALGGGVEESHSRHACRNQRRPNSFPLPNGLDKALQLVAAAELEQERGHKLPAAN